MKLLRFPLLYLLLSLWLQPAQAADHFAQTPEDHSVTLSDSALFPASSQTGQLVLSLAPQHGQVSVSGSELHYSPSQGFVGFDRFLVKKTGGSNGDKKSAEVLVTIRVVPRALPTTSRQFADGDLSPGFYDTVDRTFKFCDPWVAMNGQLYCYEYSVPQAGVGWIPATGHWPDGNLSLPPLFDAETGTLHLLAANGDSTFEIVHSLHFPETIGSWPTLGDWTGGGQTHPAFVALDGTVRVFDLNTKILIALQRQLLQMRPGAAEPWPAVWKVDGRDTLAWIDALQHKLYWREVMPSPASESLGGEVLDLVQTGRRLPITSDVLNWAGYDNALLFFEPTDMPGVEYFLTWYRDLDGSWPTPSTLPLKFPHEPPGI